MTSGPGAGYTIMQQLNAALPADGKIRYANYGKGVVFWETDAEAARFVNEFQQLTSADVYFYTDDDPAAVPGRGFLGWVEPHRRRMPPGVELRQGGRPGP